jgi:hypothetical protein
MENLNKEILDYFKEFDKTGNDVSFNEDKLENINKY